MRPRYIGVTTRDNRWAGINLGGQAASHRAQSATGTPAASAKTTHMQSPIPTTPRSEPPRPAAVALHAGSFSERIGLASEHDLPPGAREEEYVRSGSRDNPYAADEADRIAQARGFSAFRKY